MPHEAQVPFDPFAGTALVAPNCDAGTSALRPYRPDPKKRGRSERQRQHPQAIARCLRSPAASGPETMDPCM
uniref:Uncharacterized protein n=1 Tax=uncultured marine virus TaxID=186617 RepID=A0A0F7L806_9VIRU|nr:hypothetical protein [uncultured marine virus]